jgi:hypothetical protein
VTTVSFGTYILRHAYCVPSEGQVYVNLIVTIIKNLVHNIKQTADSFFWPYLILLYHSSIVWYAVHLRYVLKEKMYKISKLIKKKCKLTKYAKAAEIRTHDL